MIYKIERRGDEAWRDVVVRMSQEYSLPTDTITLFDQAIEDGMPDQYAAVNAISDGLSPSRRCR